MPREDLVENALRFAFKNSIVPEMIDILGVESVLKILKYFSGSSIRIPKFKHINLLIRDIDIYENMSVSDTKGCIKQMADRYAISTTQVLVIFNQMKKDYIQILNYKNALREIKKLEVCGEETIKF